jgi:hypothetical protein
VLGMAVLPRLDIVRRASGLTDVAVIGVAVAGVLFARRERGRA